MPGFESARLKHMTAYRQTADLYDQIRKFFSPGDDPAYRIDIERDADPRKWRAIFRLLKQPPDDWPVILGQIIHNLRSALDHLVYEASALDKDGTPLRGTEYPIYIDKSRFLREAGYKMRGLNPATKALIEKYQPFTNTDPHVVPYLWLLQQLSNTDKHRRLNFVEIPCYIAQVSFLHQTPGGVDHLPTGVTMPKARLEDGAEFYAFWTKEPLPADEKVNVNAQIAVNPLFDDATPEADGLPVFDILNGIGPWVGGLRNEFIRLNPERT